MQAAKGETSAQLDGVCHEARLVAYEYGPGSRPTSTVTTESFGALSSALSHTSSAGHCTIVCPSVCLSHGWISQKRLS